MNKLRMARPAAILTMVLALTLSGCAAAPLARMVLPTGLAARSEAIDLPALGTGRHGAVEVMGRRLQFERSGSRLAFFDELAVTRKAGLRYSLDQGADGLSTADCAAHRRTLSAGIVEWSSRPLSMFCDFKPSGVRLELQEHRPNQGAQKLSRRGRLSVGGQTFDVRSVHQAEGALFELAHPIGYVISDRDRPLAAVELRGRRPRLHLPPADDALRQPSLQALLALALLWDVADG